MENKNTSPKKPEYLTSKNVYAARLKEHIFSESVLNPIIDEIFANTGKKDFFTVFISICSRRTRASVASGTGNTLERAWKKADRRASVLAKRKNIDVKWVKADIVNDYRHIETSALSGILTDNHYEGYFRGGISFDPEFNNAFLESELNSNNIIKYYNPKEIKANTINYSEIPINMDRLNGYSEKYRFKTQIAEIPAEITVFTTRGYFCGAGDNLSAFGEIYELYSDGLNAGRRITPLANGNYISGVIINSAKYLHGLIGEDGKFVYGYRPKFNKALKGYNILRHIGSVWCLIYLYKITRDESLIPKIDAAIGYLENDISHKDIHTSFVTDKTKNEIKIGANGLAIIMLTEYTDAFKTDKHLGLVRKLADGILSVQNESGAYYHILNWPDYSGKEEFRSVFYEGEATFALTRAYTFTKDEKYLTAAKLSVENFIRNDYIRYHDHWISYSLNEITQYADDVRYYEFALKNAAGSFGSIYKLRISRPTNIEMLMCVWMTYERARERGVRSEYIDKFDVIKLAEIIYTLVQRHLNGYFYPEFAMYIDNPEKFVNSHFVRRDAFRVRIDDIQHFFGGNYLYSLCYDRIRPYLSDKFLAQINSEESFFSRLNRLT